MKKKIIAYSILIVFMLVFAIGVWIRIGVEPSNRIIFHSGGNNLGLYEEGDVLEQEIPIKCEGVKNILVSFATFGKADNAGKLSIHVKNEDGELIGERIVAIAEIADCSYQAIEINQSLSKGEKVTATIEIIELEEGSKLTSFITNGDSVENDLVVNGEKKSYELHILVETENNTVYSIFAVVMILVLAVTIGMVLHYILNGKIVYHRLFLVISIGLGIIYMLMLPVRTVPDEDAHIVTAYNISNKLLGTDELSSNGKIYMRYCDTHASYLDRPRDEQIVDLLGEYFSLPSQEDKIMVETTYGRGGLNEPLESYILSAIGITVGRVLGLGGAMTLLLGRLFNYILYVFVTYFAIKRIPFGKISLLIISAFPMVMQQAMSYSYDSLTLASIMMFVSYFCLFMSDKDALNIKEFLIMFLNCIIISRIKNSAYIPLLFVLLIPIFKYRKDSRRKKLAQQLLIILVVVAIFMVVSKVAEGMLADVSTVTMPTNYYTIGFFLEHPKKLLMIIVNTVMQKFDFYLYTLVGYSLSHFDIYMPSFVAVIYLFILFISMLQNEGEKASFNNWEKVLSVLWSLVSAGGIMMALLTGFTVMGQNRIEGVQGRYFLPQLILLSQVLRIGAIRLKKDLSGVLIISALVLQSFTIYSIIEYYLLR